MEWEEALEFTAKNLKELKEKYGPDAIAGFSSAKCTNEENYLFQKFMRAVIGTNNVDHCARLCHASTLAGLAKAFGSGAMTNSIAELENARCILITGSNTSEAHPIIALRIKKAVKENGAKLIVADPRKIDMVRFADIYLQQKPGTDVALFNGMMNVILKENLQDDEFIKNRTENFEEFGKVVEKYDPKYTEKITGVPAEKIIEAARTYATSRPASIVYSMGITQHTTGTDNVMTLANLSMLTGNVGKESSGVNPLRGQNNVQGACDMGALPNLLPGYQSVLDENIRKKFGDFWATNIPSNPGLTVVEMMHSAFEFIFANYSRSRSEKMKIFANNIIKKYGNKVVLDRITVEFEEGSFTCIVGPNGAGKTTFLRILNMLEQQDNGEVYYDGNLRRVSKLSLQKRMTMVMQNPVMLNTSVLKNIAYGLEVRGEKETGAKVKLIMKELELSEFADNPALKLSSGEMQRVSVARTLVFEPEVLLLDEPTCHLDAWNRRLIQNTILSLQSRCKTTIILATYDIAEIERFSGKLFYLESGKIKDWNDATEIVNTNKTNSLTPRI